MLGSSGGLPEYWNIHKDSDGKDISTTSPIDSLSTPVSSVSTAIGAQNQQSSLAPLRSDDGSESSPSKRTVSPDSFISSRLIDNSQIEAIQNTPPSSPPAILLTPHPACPQPRNRILRIVFDA
ncbi:hypothetical protein RRF57_007357 [Xylaria bambusicola]|uniref:Uncharacterized protein n=1 Tax=Xylaria bambusicola TaxID=326684 RepID=A0AAN7ZAH3_9PEZI